MSYFAPRLGSSPIRTLEQMLAAVGQTATDNIMELLNLKYLYELLLTDSIQSFDDILKLNLTIEYLRILQYKKRAALSFSRHSEDAIEHLENIDTLIFILNQTVVN